MQTLRSRFNDSFKILGALVPAFALAIVAFAALPSGQVQAETEEEPQGVACAGLYSLTMSVNTMTLYKNGSLTKHSYSSDRECRMSMTLIDVSSDDNPADKIKICTVTASPVWVGNTLDLTFTESGDCDTVAIDVSLDFGDSGPGGGAWAPYTGPEEERSAPSGPGEGGAFGQASCVYTAGGDNPHISSAGPHVSVHGWWNSWSENCPSRSRVKVWLKAFYCWNEALNWCAWITVGYKKHDVRARNLSGNWVNARDYCRPATTYTSYQGIVDVDLIGQRDPPDRRYSRIRDFLCNP